MKRFLSSVLSLSLLASMVSVPVLADEGKTTITPQMTWVDYDNADTAMGYIAAGSTARSGYNKISGGTIGMANTTWGEDKVAYLKVDASSITDSNIVSAVLSMDVSGSSDNKRTCAYGLVETAYTGWDDTLTYNGVVANNMLSGTALGDVAWTSTKSSTTFETKTFDITEALNNDADRVLTLAIYETAAAGGYIKNPSVVVEHSNQSVYTITYDVDGVVTEEKVVEGEYVAEVPETVKTGYLFKGWIKNDTSSAIFPTEAVTGTAVESDLKWTAVFEKDPDYIEPITAMTVTGPATMTLGPDPDTAVANTYSITLTGELGTDIVANPDSRATDYNVEWEFLGYKTENDTEDQYCDSYGSVTYNGTPATSVDFNLKNVSFNFFGKIKATVTYNGQKVEAYTYATIIGDSTSDPNVILPTAGYPSDFSSYSNELIGYECTSETYGASKDAILGGFCLSGSDGGKTAVLMEEDGEKFIRMTKTAASKSGMTTHTISAPTTQIILEQNVRFNSTGGCITMTAGYPFWSSNASYGDALAFSFNGSAVTLNGVALVNGDNPATISSGTWYKVVISADKTNETAYAQIYDKTGATLIGEIYDVAWNSSCSPNFYSFGLGNSNTGTIDFNNYKVYYPTVDTESFTIATESETLSIPAAESTTLVASVKSTNGYKITGDAEWKITDETMAEGVTITPDATDSHKAVVSVGASAVPGTLPIQVTIGGYSKTIELTLTSSADSIKFTKSSSSVSIPLEEGATESVQFEAIVIDKDAQKVNDCTYAVYDKNNSAELTTLPAGITFDAATGTLTVAAGAMPATLTIRATGNNSSGESISKAVKVTVHGLSFDFGAGTDADIAEGYTSVTPDTAYTENLGFGIVGGATAGGAGSTTDANGDYLEGSFKFNAKVAAGNVYKVTVNFSGNMVSEYVSSVLSGHTRTLAASDTTYTGYTVATSEIAEQVYYIPVVDDVLDLSFTGAKVASISVEKVERVASGKPHIYAVGDSTLGNNGSYGYVLARDQANYPELTALATYHNNGKGSRTLSTYYTQGWLDGVLASVNPGDIVTIGNMGTNAGGLSGSAFKAPLDYYVDAALAMGAKVILTSYTPHGAVSSWAGGYNSATQTFNSYRTDSYDSEGIRVIYEERKNDEGILGFIDIGKNADAAFNAYVDDYAANGYASRDAAAQAIIACFPDHNHYNGLACQLMLNGYGDATGIVPELVRLLSAEDDSYNVSYHNGYMSEADYTAIQKPVAGKITSVDGLSELKIAEDAKTKYDEAFFAEKFLAVLTWSEPVSARALEVKKISVSDSAISVAMKENALDDDYAYPTVVVPYCAVIEMPIADADKDITVSVELIPLPTATPSPTPTVDPSVTATPSPTPSPTPTPTPEPTEEPSNKPDVVGENLITNGNFANGTTDWTNALDGGTYTGTLTAEAPYVHGDGQALTNTVSAGGSTVSTLRRYIPVEAGKKYYLSYYVYNTGAAISDIAFMSAFVPVKGNVFGSFNGLTFMDYVEYGGQNSWSAEPQSQVNRTRDDMDYTAGMNHKEFIITIPEGADNILMSMFAWTDPGRLYISDFEMYEVAAAEETPTPSPSVPPVEETPTPSPSVPPVEETPSPSPSVPPVEETPTPSPSVPPVEDAYEITFDGNCAVAVYTDENQTERLEAPYKTTDGKIFFEIIGIPGGGDCINVEASNGTLTSVNNGYLLTDVTEDVVITHDHYTGPFMMLTAEKNEDGTVTAEVRAGYANVAPSVGVVIMAVYEEDGSLHSLKIVDAINYSHTFNFTDIPANATFKAMWWTSLADMEPVIEAETAVIE